MVKQKKGPQPRKVQSPAVQGSKSPKEIRQAIRDVKKEELEKKVKEKLAEWNKRRDEYKLNKDKMSKRRREAEEKKIVSLLNEALELQKKLRFSERELIP